jgi:hypothetical protein
MRAFSLGLILCLALSAAGCGGDEAEGGDTDASVGGDADAAVTADAGADAGADGDSGSDLGADGADASDTGAETGGDADTVTASGPIDATAMSALCAEALANACVWATQCQSGAFEDCSDWAGYTSFEKGCAGVVAAIASGAVEVSAERAAECRASLVAPGCDMWPPPIFDPPCRDLGTPLVAVGGACKAATSWSSQCVGGYCNIATGDCVGKCQASAAAGGGCPNGIECDEKIAYCAGQKCTAWGVEGQSCASVQCGTGLRCDPLTTKCIVTKAEGAPCERSVECVWPNTCSPTGKCAAKVPVGGDCNTNANCLDGGACVHIADPGVCFVPASTGEPCPAPGSGGCVEDHVCARTGDTEATTCQRFGRDGDPCSDGVPCAQGFYCDRTLESWLCRPLGGPGDPCNSASNDSPTIPCLAGLSCLADQCRSPGIAGAVCNPGYQATCAPGFWCDPAVSECKVAGAASDPCDLFVSTSCAASLWCDSATKACAPPSAIGGPCFHVWPSCDAAAYCGCPDPQACDFGEPADWRCLAKKSDGALCDSIDECAGGACLPDVSGTLRCETYVPPPICEP